MRYYTAVCHPDGWRYTGHCYDHPAHPTEADARRCRQDWLRSQVQLGDRRVSWNRCAIRDCKAPAQKMAVVQGSPYDMAVLCDEHWTVEDAIRAMRLDEEQAGDRWES